MKNRNLVRAGAAVIIAFALAGFSGAAAAASIGPHAAETLQFTEAEEMPQSGGAEESEDIELPSSGEGAVQSEDFGEGTAVFGLPDEGAVTLGSDDLCGDSPYFEADSGVMTIDLSGSEFEHASSLTIADDDPVALSCAADITELVFERSGEGDGPTDLTIGEGTFSQESEDDNKLESVTFPEGLESLTIGDQAFYQYASTGSNALTSVVFPESLNELTVAEMAFAQVAASEEAGGDNKLVSVTFPAAITSLSIGDMAFYQHTFAGSNALANVMFPAKLESLTIGMLAFYQGHSKGGRVLESVVFPKELTLLEIDSLAFALISVGPDDVPALLMFFPFDKDGVPEVTLGENIAGTFDTGGVLTADDSALWVWLGENGVMTQNDSDGWNSEGDGDYELHGARAAQFNANGGVSDPPDQLEELYVFPATGDDPQAAPLAEVGELDPSGFLTEEGPDFLVAMPSAQWQGNPADTELAGWCSGDWKDGGCVAATRGGLRGAGPFQPGGNAVLSEAGTTVFSAGWKVVPEVPKRVPATACGVKPTVTIPESNLLYSYDPAEFDSETAGDEFTVKAQRNEPYVVWGSGAQTRWDFDLKATPCEPSTSPTLTTPSTEEASGTGVPGAEVTVTDKDGNELCTAEVQPNGTWSCSFEANGPLDPGTEIDATQTEPGKAPSDKTPGQVPDPSDEPGLNVPTTEGASGTGVPGSTVTVTGPNGSDEVLCTAEVDSEGTWSCEFGANGPLDRGDVVGATQTTPGKTGPSGMVTSAVPGETDPPVVDPPTTGGVTGTGVPGAEITVTDKETGAELCTAVVQPNGTWSCSFEPEVDPGTEIEVSQKEEDKDPSVTVPAQVPDPADEPGLNVPTTEEVSGTGVPGSTVTVTGPNGSDEVLCTAVVDSEGNWSCEFGENGPLVPGDSVSATQTTPGKTGPSSPVTGVVPQPGTSVPPTIGTVTPEGATGTGVPGASITVTDKETGKELCTTEVGPDGTWSCEFGSNGPLSPGVEVEGTQTEDGKEPSAPVTGVVPPVVVPGTSVPPTIGTVTPEGATGTGVPGASITVTDEDGNELCSATVGGDGNWSCSFKPGAVKPGQTVNVTQTEPGKSPSEAVTAKVVGTEIGGGDGSSSGGDTGAGSASGGLAVTGAEVGGLIAAGGALLLVGLALTRPRKWELQEQ